VAVPRRPDQGRGRWRRPGDHGPYRSMRSPARGRHDEADPRHARGSTIRYDSASPW